MSGLMQTLKSGLVGSESYLPGARLDRRRRARRGAHWRRHLDRFRHSGFPRSARRMDKESGRREDVEHPFLPRRSGGAQSFLAEPPQQPRLVRETQRRAQRARRARAARQAARADHAEHRRAAPDCGQLARARDRGARLDAPLHVLGLRHARADADRARARARRRRRSALPRLRWNPEERHHFLRPAARSGGDRARDGSGRRGGSLPRRRLEPAGVSDRRRGRHRALGRRENRHHERSAHAVRRHRRCGPAGIDQRNTAQGVLVRKLLVLLLFAAQSAAAQSWPAKPVKIIVPFAPGGTADTLGRLLAQKLTEQLKENFVVENRPGAGGILGSELAAKAAPDGYTFVVSGIASHVIAPSLPQGTPYDPLRDFTHVALFGGPPAVFAVNPSIPARDLREFVSLARQKPGTPSYGSPGNRTQ